MAELRAPLRYAHTMRIPDEVSWRRKLAGEKRRRKPAEDGAAAEAADAAMPGTLGMRVPGIGARGRAGQPLPLSEG